MEGHSVDIRSELTTFSFNTCRYVDRWIGRYECLYVYMFIYLKEGRYQLVVICYAASDVMGYYRL